MAGRKRWGKKHKDKRNWKTENEKYVKRGEFYINPVFLDTWLSETKEMNNGKVGQPYLYPNSLIEFLAQFHAKSYNYRELEGITAGLSRRFSNFPVISFSQARRRILGLNLEFKPKSDNLFVGTDSSGIKVSNRGEWIREKWDERRGWIKVVVMGDTEGNIVDIRIGNEGLDENASSRGMVRKNHKQISKWAHDGLGDVRDNFRLAENYGIEPVIKIRSNASTRSRGCMARKKKVIEYKKLGYKKWAKEKGYGKRWVATEGIYSAVKRMLGEGVNSHKTKNMYHEVRLKFWLYQQIRDINK